MPTSLDSSRPIMAPSTRNSVRYSTYSMSPSVANTVRTSDSAVAEIQDIENGLERLEDKRLSSQRVVLSDQKHEDMKKVALGAKLERALGRRMSSQDAEFRPRAKSATVPKTLNEKEVAA